MAENNINETLKAAEEKSEHKYQMASLFVALAAVAVMAAMFIGTSQKSVIEEWTEEKVDSTREVVALDSLGYSQQYEMERVLGHAHAYTYTDNGSYIVLVKNTDGSFEKVSIPENGTLLYPVGEDDEDGYRLVTMHDVVISRTAGGDVSEKGTGRYGQNEYRYKLYVPEGSIATSGFDLNLPGDTVDGTENTTSGDAESTAVNTPSK